MTAKPAVQMRIGITESLGDPNNLGDTAAGQSERHRRHRSSVDVCNPLERFGHEAFKPREPSDSAVRQTALFVKFVQRLTVRQKHIDHVGGPLLSATVFKNPDHFF